MRGIGEIRARKINQREGERRDWRYGVGALGSGLEGGWSAIGRADCRKIVSFQEPGEGVCRE